MAAKANGIGGTLTAKVVTVTPKLAMSWMEKNARNRPPKARHIDRLAEQMQAGNWRLTGEPIIFGSDGSMINGQHRLSACILSDKDFATLVVWGVEPSAFNKLDQGIKRTLGDAFGRERKKNATNLAACCYTLWQLEHQTIQRIPLTIDEGFAVLRRHPLAERYVSLSRAFSRATRPMVASMCAAYLTWTAESWGKKAVDFWTKVCTSENVASGSWELKLIKALRGDVNQRLTDAAKRAYCVKAFNAYITEAKPTKLSYDPTREAVPEFLR